MDWYSTNRDEILQRLNSDADTGLTSTEAEERLRRYGTNELVDQGKKSPWRIFAVQFTEVMVIVLLIAALISLLLGEYTEVVVILAIVALNAVLGFSQEYRAEQAMAALKQLSVPTVRVRRDAEVTEVSSTNMAPGDIVLLEAGNIVPADGRILTSMSLKAQESALTGESEPIDKQVEVIHGTDIQIGDQTNMVHMGTIITYGRGAYVVTETGMDTQLGRIADLIQGVEEEETPLQRRLADLNTFAEHLS